MSIYEYQCPQCNKIIEFWAEVDERQEPTCKTCKIKMPKIISQSSFHLKGSGWARNGYSKEKG